MKRGWRLALGLVILLLVGWGLGRAPWSDLVAVLGRLTFGGVALLLVVNVLIVGLFGVRLDLILRAQETPVRFLTLVGYRLAGFAVSYFTPGPQFGGEPLQVLLLRQRHRLPGATAVTAITLDKLFELLANFTFLVVGVLVARNRGALLDGQHLPAVAATLGLLLAPLLYLGALAAGWAPLTRLLQSRGRAARVHALIATVEGQIFALSRRQPRPLLLVVLVSGLVWLALIGEYWLMARVLGVELSLGQTIAALTAARIAFLTPLPGGLGALEASQVFIMEALGFPAAVGLSLSLLIRGRDLLFALLGLSLGGWYRQANSGPPASAEALAAPENLI
jgi:uncharacterized protein (TIRG00374 family)